MRSIKENNIARMILSLLVLFGSVAALGETDATGLAGQTILGPVGGQNTEAQASDVAPSLSSTSQIDDQSTQNKTRGRDEKAEDAELFDSLAYLGQVNQHLIREGGYLKASIEEARTDLRRELSKDANLKSSRGRGEQGK